MSDAGTGAAGGELNDAGDEPENLTQTVVRGAGLAGSGYVLAQVLNLGFYIALARLATPHDFGILAAGSVLLGAALLLTESGMMAAIVHRRDRLDESIQTALVATTLGGVVLTILSVATAPLLGLFFRSDQVAEVAAVLSGTILLKSGGAIPAARLQREFSFLRRLVIEPAAVVAFGVSSVVATANGMGVWGLVIGYYALAGTEFVLSWVLAPIRPRLGLVSYELWRELAGYGRHVLAATVILRVGDQADTGIVGRFVGTAALGQFRYAFRLAATPYWTLLAGASYVLFPAFARISDNRERFERGFMRSLRWLCVGAFPVGMLLLPLGEPGAVVLFGETWREAGQATMAMCLFPCASALSSIASEGLKAAGKPQRLTRMHTVTTVATAAAMLALLPFGLIGVAAGLSVGAVIGGIYALQQIESHLGFPVRPMLAEIWPPAVASLVMAALLLGGERLADAGTHSVAVDLALILGGALAGLLIFLGVLRLLAPATVSELMRAAASLPGRLRRARTGSGTGSPPAIPEGQ
jgi:O-antigen/teichoic acid export membrane protein